MTRNTNYSQAQTAAGSDNVSGSPILFWDEHKKGLWNSAFLDGHVKAADMTDLARSHVQYAWFGKNSVGDPLKLF